MSKKTVVAQHLIDNNIKLAREDIKEYRQYILRTTKISATAGTVTQK